MSWAFYNSSGECLSGTGAWLFFNSSGEVLGAGSGSGGSDCGDCDLLTTGGADPELVFADGNVIWI